MKDVGLLSETWGSIFERGTDQRKLQRVRFKLTILDIEKNLYFF